MKISEKSSTKNDMCGNWADGMNGPFFIENLKEWIQIELLLSDTKPQNIELFRCPSGLISRNSQINCSPKSCILIPLDYFLWGLLQNYIYGNINDRVEKHTKYIQGVRYFFTNFDINVF